MGDIKKLSEDSLDMDTSDMYMQIPLHPKSLTEEQMKETLLEQMSAIDNSKNNIKIIEKRLNELSGHLTQLRYHQEVLWMETILEFMKSKLDIILTYKRRLDDPRLICNCKSPNLICQIHDEELYNKRRKE